MRLVSFSLLLLPLLCQAGIGAEIDAIPGWYAEQRPLYSGIPVQVRFTPEDPELAAAVWRYLEGIDEVFNDYRDTSEIGRLNLAGTGRHAVSGELAEAFAISRRLGRLTDGAFDITVGPLRRLWREGERTGHAPSPDVTSAALQAMGPSTWAVDGRTVETRVPGVRFDVGGMIKGVAVDHALGLLMAGGATSALVQCGGETGCFGVNPRGQPHRLGIPDPEDPAQISCAIADPGTGLSGSTSGNYFNAVVIDGREYYHVFDPRTGVPVDTHVLSVSVVFPRCGHNALADGLCKLGIVRGAAALLPVVQRLGGAALVMTRTRDGRVTVERSPTWDAFQVASPASDTPEVRP